MKSIKVAVLAAALLAMAAHASDSTRDDSAQGQPIINAFSLEEAGLMGAVGIIQIDESAFQAGSGLITFSEFPLLTNNPTYQPGDYGGVASDPTVTFGGFFLGQALGNAASCPPGAALTGCVVGTPSGPLTLDPSSPPTQIRQDGANPTSPVLSGTPTFNGPIAIMFDSDVAGVGLDGGFFDAIGGTAITAFARDGSVIGSVTNDQLEIEFLGLVTSDGSNAIAGLLFSLVGSEPAGFAIDNVRFGRGDSIIIPGQPSPAVAVPTMGMSGLIALAAFLLLFGWIAVRRW